jgi:hypothetical protein
LIIWLTIVTWILYWFWHFIYFLNRFDDRLFKLWLLLDWFNLLNDFGAVLLWYVSFCLLLHLRFWFRLINFGWPILKWFSLLWGNFDLFNRSIGIIFWCFSIRYRWSYIKNLMYSFFFNPLKRLSFIYQKSFDWFLLIFRIVYSWGHQYLETDCIPYQNN